MIPLLPIEILASVLSHLEDDRETLKRASLASRHLCFLAQEFLFSTICITHSTRLEKLLELENILTGPRGANIVLAIRTLNFRDSTSVTVRVLQFIADHAKRLRAIHFGPFFRAPLNLPWNSQSEELRFILTRLFKMAEEIIIEGVHHFPTSLFPTLRNLKHLDFSGSHLSPEFTLESPSLAFPRSLTLHAGVLGHGRSLNNTLPVFTSLRLISFSNLRVLYLYAPFARGRNALYRDVISMCDCKRLESLRFYIEGTDTTDPNIHGPIINLGHLTSLRSLYVIVNVSDSLGCLARIVNTLSLPQTHLKELVLFIDTFDSSMEEDPWLEEMIMEVEHHSESWKSLDSKLAQIFKAWDDTEVVIQFPPVDPLLNEDVHYFVEDQLPEISEYMHRRFHLLDLNFRNIVSPHLSFRADEDQARILEDELAVQSRVIH